MVVAHQQVDNLERIKSEENNNEENEDDSEEEHDEGVETEAVIDEETEDDFFGLQQRLNQEKILQEGENRLVEVPEKVIIIIGKEGTGKSSLLSCVDGNRFRGQTSLGSCTDFVERILQEQRGNNRHLILKLYSWRLRGVKELDWLSLHELERLLAKKTPILSCVLLTFSSNLFSHADQNIVDLILRFTSKEFQELIRVVITHASEDAITDEFRDQLCEKLAFLGSSREAILSKILFVDLPSPHIPPTEVHGRYLVGQKWIAAKEQLMNVFEECPSNKEVLVKDMRSMHWLQEMVVVYWFKLLFLLSAITVVVCAVLVVMFRFQTQQAKMDAVLNWVQGSVKH